MKETKKFRSGDVVTIGGSQFVNWLLLSDENNKWYTVPLTASGGLYDDCLCVETSIEMFEDRINEVLFNISSLDSHIDLFKTRIREESEDEM